MISIEAYIQDFERIIPAHHTSTTPWNIVGQSSEIIATLMANLSDEYKINGTVAIHRTATVEQNVVFHGPCIISENAFIWANCYFREGVFIGESVKIGPSCEIKSAFIFSHTAIAHLNYVGNSLVGSYVNIEGGAVIANHFNECKDKKITVRTGDDFITTDVTKFWALIGDHTKIGANAVTSPWTILLPHSIVGRLELIDQMK